MKILSFINPTPGFYEEAWKPEDITAPEGDRYLQRVIRDLYAVAELVWPLSFEAQPTDVQGIAGPVSLARHGAG